MGKTSRYELIVIKAEEKDISDILSNWDSFFF